tara:strand:+ start:26913 stop:27302 length:390 start_codon:yes stop_codon:yes gene_type:complete
MNIVTINHLNAALRQIAEAMSAKGIIEPSPEIDFKQSRVTGWLHAAGKIGGRNCVDFYGDDASKVAATMLAYVEALKSVEEEKVLAWQRSLGALIDDGASLDLPDEVMAGLRTSSKAMTENLITKQKDS